MIGPIVGPVALAKRQHSGRKGDDEEQSHRDRQSPQPAGAAASPVEIGSLVGAPGLEELLLEGVEVGGVGGGPVVGGGEAAAAVEAFRLAARGVPVVRGVGELLVHAAAVAVVVEPCGQARPFAQQRFVGDFGGLLVGGDEPSFDEGGEHFRRGRVTGGELVEAGAPTHVAGCVVFGGPGEAQEHLARDALLVGVEVVVDTVGEARDGGAHTAGLRVGHEGEAATAPAFPHLEQRGRQQGERAGFAGDVGGDRVGESYFEREPGVTRGRLDGAADLVVAHRAHEHVVALEPIGQRGVARARAVVVSAQGRDHGDRAVGRGGRFEQRR